MVRECLGCLKDVVADNASFLDDLGVVPAHIEAALGRLEVLGIKGEGVERGDSGPDGPGIMFGSIVEYLVVAWVASVLACILLLLGPLLHTALCCFLPHLFLTSSFPSLPCSRSFCPGASPCLAGLWWRLLLGPILRILHVQWK